MKALLLDGSPPGDHLTTSAADALERDLVGRGYETERVTLRDLEIRACTGCFGCWTRRPGECVIDDAARGIAEHGIAADVLAIATPVSFGSYGSLVKGVFDRLICLILPFFTVRQGEVHHEQRYERYPSLVVLGTQRVADAEDAALFRRLVGRNALNIDYAGHAVGVAAATVEPQDARLVLARALDGSEVTV